MSGKIIVIDDESSILAVIEAMLINENYEVHTFENPKSGIEHYKTKGADIIISDIKMNEMDGVTVLKEIKSINPEAIVILITAYSNAQDAMNALKIGAYDYIQKPFKMESLRSLVKRAFTVHKILDVSENKKIKENEIAVEFCNIYTKNAVMKKLFELVRKVAPSKTTILIQGESGTGKELFAKAIHALSEKQNEPFVAINCAALPEHLLESELFGHVKGSFTGAINDNQGLFKAAKNGTIFLDEISSLSLNLQTKLLRVLQEKEIRPVGAMITEKINCRVIAATNESLEKLLAEKKFREDLYYRLNIIPIEIPPLRERSEDIVLLVYHFFKKFASDKKFILSPQTINILLEYNWPGNIRELENVIERITTLNVEGEIGVESLPLFMKKDSHFLNINSFEKILPLKKFVSMAEGQYISSVLKKFDNDKALAAKYLEIDSITINRKLERFEKLQNT